VSSLDDKTLDSHQVFYSPNVTVLGVYPVDGKLFVFGTAKNGDNAVYAYQLLSSDDTTPGKRWIDQFPLAAGTVTGVNATDLVGDTVAIHLTSGNSEDQKLKAGDAIRALGIGIDQNKIVFIK
jgi:hypothetical protein